MAHRFLLYEALRSLNKGNILYVKSDLSALQYLEECPEVSHIVDMLITNCWVKPIDEDETEFVITQKGREVFEEGHSRYITFPLWKKILGRTYLFSFKW